MSTLRIKQNETIFKPHSITYRSWAHKYSNQVLKKEGINLNTLAAAVVISPKFGLECFRIKPKSIKTEDLLQIIQDLEIRYKGRKLTIFLDNLRAHHSKVFGQFVEERGWTLLFNAPYSSRYNCIENVFSRVKKHYKKDLIKLQFKLSNSKHFQVVKDSIQKIDTIDCVNSEEFCINQLKSQTCL